MMKKKSQGTGILLFFFENELLMDFIFSQQHK